MKSQKHQFKQTEIGMIPEDWKVTELDKIAEIIDCLHSKKPEKKESGFSTFLRINLQLLLNKKEKVI